MANTNWENLPSTNTPINATNLNKISDGLVNVSNSVDSTYKTNLITGKNLYSNFNFSGSNLGINYTFNGSKITLNNTTTSNGTIIDTPTIYLKAGTYSLQTIKISGSVEQTTQETTIYIRKVGSTTNYINATSYNNYTTTGTLELNEDTEIYVKIFTNASGMVFNNLVIGLQIEEGSTSTSFEDFTYNEVIVNGEKYSDTLNVGTGVDSRSRVNILHSNNIFSSSLELGSIDNNTGNNTSSNDCLRNKDYIIVEPNTQYTIKNDKSYHIYIYEYASNYSFIQYTGASTSEYATQRTFTTTSTTRYIRIRTIASLVENDLTSKWQLNKGSTALPYEPYITPSINVDGDTIYKRTSAINGTLSSDYSISASNTYEKIPFNTTTIIGSNLSLNNNVIVIGEGIDYIDISSSIYIQAVGGTGVKYIKILKNNSTIDLKYVTVSANAYYMFTSTNIIPVSENDTIEIQAYGLQNDKIIKNSSIVVKTI